MKTSKSVFIAGYKVSVFVSVPNKPVSGDIPGTEYWVDELSNNIITEGGDKIIWSRA